VYRPVGSGSVRTMPATEKRVALPPRYRVVRHIADGGMASVWAAEDELLGRLVAVKVLSHAYDADERARRRFLREARAAAKLGDCRHVVTVYDIGEHEDRAFMVMEHFAGGTVGDRLRERRRLPRPVAVRWLRETAIALDCAHGHDVVHRDVKPGNLLLDEHGRLAVGDFGIATVASEASVTQTGQVLGTAAYISPEQARGLAATAASDRYALAVVAFELLTGSRPFDVDHPAAQARAHVHDEVPPATGVAADLPPAVDDVLRDGMAKDPEARPPSAEDLVDRLEDALGDEATAVVPPATAATRPVEAVSPATVAGAAAAEHRRAAAAAREARFRRSATTTGARPTTSRPTTPPPSSPPPAAARPGPGPRRWPAVAALAALLLVAGTVVAVAFTGGGGGDRTAGTSSTPTTGTSAQRHHTTSTRRASTTPRTTSNQSPAATQGQSAPATTATTPPPAAGAGAGDPKDLNNRGFALLQQGNATAAVPLLQQSVHGFRSQGRTGEIDYAFALFNLGAALRAVGDPRDAIPLLEERLRVSDYKRGVVQQELAAARAQAGQGGAAPAPPPAQGPGKARGKRGHGNKGHGKGGGGD
jgi:eukaryotic-like serine/threonine-protein kinase